MLDSVSPVDNRGCFHAASVLTAFLIAVFGPNFQPTNVAKALFYDPDRDLLIQAVGSLTVLLNLHCIVNVHI